MNRGSNPYHYFEADVELFVSALQGTGIYVRVTDWYPTVQAHRR